MRIVLRIALYIAGAAVAAYGSGLWHDRLPFWQWIASEQFIHYLIIALPLLLLVDILFKLYPPEPRPAYRCAFCYGDTRGECIRVGRCIQGNEGSFEIRTVDYKDAHGQPIAYRPTLADAVSYVQELGGFFCRNGTPLFEIKNPDGTWYDPAKGII